MDFFLNSPKSPKLVIYQIFFQRNSFLYLLQFRTRYVETFTNISKENNEKKSHKISFSPNSSYIPIFKST